MSLDSEDLDRIAKIKVIVAQLNSEVSLLPISVLVEYETVTINTIGAQPTEALYIHMLEKL